jgi:enamine deaminase RidA (YjgF/YER057c/UK114 family)
MTLELINPEALPTPESYTQVVAATGSRLVFVAGQVADDPQGGLVGRDDLAAQARQAFANVGRALAAAGAGPEHVARITIYVVHHRPQWLPVISEARAAVFGDHLPADTLVGVEALAEPGYLVEVEASAVVD